MTTIRDILNDIIEQTASKVAENGVLEEDEKESIIDDAIGEITNKIVG